MNQHSLKELIQKVQDLRDLADSIGPVKGEEGHLTLVSALDHLWKAHMHLRLLKKLEDPKPEGLADQTWED